MLVPRHTVPALSVATLSHGDFDITKANPDRGTILCFYRGLHCPICAKYLMELGKLNSTFAEKGYETIAISSDTQERAQEMADKISSPDLRMGYGLSLASAREWGLSVSTSVGTTSIGIEEPPLFSEPGLFVVESDMTLYYGSVQTMPFVRPHFSELAGALDFAIEKNYPARGEYVGEV